ncbi:MAG: iron-containing alcohol dehydrogenase [Pseudomonadota bacterium]
MSNNDSISAWNYPTSVLAGAGAIGQLAQCCKTLGMHKPLLVTDPALASLPMVEAAVSAMRDGGLAVDVFSEVKSNPVSENVSAGVAAYKRVDCDGIVAFGGGSAMDAAKVIALMVGQHRPLWDFVDEADNWQRADAAAIAPILAVPTTAGTGSEVGRAAVITDEQAQIKHLIFHPKLLPSQVILDPELTVGLPPHLTAATGMDALSHNLEALCSPVYHPMASGIAAEGIRLVHDYLPRAVSDGDDINARMQMITASAMGATAFQKGLGAMHALAHPLGALYDAHHGLLNAILMPYVLITNRKAIDGEIARLSRYLNLPKPDFGGFCDWVLQLRQEIGIPHSLAEIGIDTLQQERIGVMATLDPTAATNPVALTSAQYSALLCRAVNGEL